MLVSPDFDPEAPPDAPGVNAGSSSLSWSGVRFAVKGREILREIGGEVKSKSLCAIMGPSGAGKSSLSVKTHGGRSVLLFAYAQAQSRRAAA